VGLTATSSEEAKINQLFFFSTPRTKQQLRRGGTAQRSAGGQTALIWTCRAHAHVLSLVSNYVETNERGLVSCTTHTAQVVCDPDPVHAARVYNTRCRTEACRLLRLLRRATAWGQGWEPRMPRLPECFRHGVSDMDPFFAGNAVGKWRARGCRCSTDPTNCLVCAVKKGFDLIDPSRTAVF
jgi:hypothetical protein